MKSSVLAVVVAVWASVASAVDTWTFRLEYSEPLEGYGDSVLMIAGYDLSGELLPGGWLHQPGIIYNDIGGHPGRYSSTDDITTVSIVVGNPGQGVLERLVHVDVPAAGFWDDQPLDAISRLSAGDWYVDDTIDVTLLGVDYVMGERGPASADIFPDGAIDALDAGILFFAWNSSPPLYDFNYDGYLDAADAGIMFEQWTGDAAPVPEPTTAAPFLTGLLALRRYRSYSKPEVR